MRQSQRRKPPENRDHVSTTKLWGQHTKTKKVKEPYPRLSLARLTTECFKSFSRLFYKHTTHEPSRGTLVPSSLFRVGKTILANTDYHRLRDLCLEYSVVRFHESLYGGQFTLSTQLIKPNYLVILPTDAAPQFL